MAERKKIKLFNPSFICSAADESLIGKRVFYSDSLDDIAFMVNEGETGRMGIISGFIADGGFCMSTGTVYEYAYYDLNYETKIAYNQGKQIQKRWSASSPWEDIPDPLWLDDFEYRVRPEEAWRPYKDFDEFLADVEERFPSTRNRPEGTMPLIWVTPKQGKIYLLITRYDTYSGVAFYTGAWKSFREMLNSYTFTDGTPFGKKE